MKLAKSLVPTIAALASLVVMAGAGGLYGSRSGYTVSTAPTPYSADHAVAQLPGTDDIGAPTF